MVSSQKAWHNRRVKSEKTIESLKVREDRSFGEKEGFLVLRRVGLANIRDDKTCSNDYVCDFIERPKGLDAVVVVVFDKGEPKTKILLRDGLRPSLSLAREDETRLFFTEVVAGIIEAGEETEGDRRRRAAAEVKEEAGFTIEPSELISLGGKSYPSPGAFPEAFHFYAASVDPNDQSPLEGDGSPMEEGASTRWADLDAAILACSKGEIPDLKTEVILRRLRDFLA